MPCGALPDFVSILVNVESKKILDETQVWSM